MNKYDLQTGDILLFDNTENGGFINGLSKLIKWGTHSNYTHVAMVLKDPCFIHPTLKGLYVWESGWEGKPDPQDGKLKLGVQLTPLEEVIQNNRGKYFIRKLECSDELFKKTFTNENLEEVHKIVYDKMYDINPLDWVGALFRKDSNPKKTDRFWCSALMGIIYSKLGIISDEIDWSILRPSDFSIEDKNEHLQYNAGFKYSVVSFCW